VCSTLTGDTALMTDSFVEMRLDDADPGSTGRGEEKISRVGEEAKDSLLEGVISWVELEG